MGRVGEVILRTWQTAHVDEGTARRAARRRPGRQRAGPPLRREVHDLPGGRARHRSRGRFGRGRQARRPRAVGSTLLRRAPTRRRQGRLHRVGADGRRQCIDPEPAAGVAPPDVRRVARSTAHTSLTFVAPAAIEAGLARTARACDRAARRGPRHTFGSARTTCPRTTRMPRIEVDPDSFAVRIDGEAHRRGTRRGAADGPALLPVLMPWRLAAALLLFADGRFPVGQPRALGGVEAACAAAVRVTTSRRSATTSHGRLRPRGCVDAAFAAAAAAVDHRWAELDAALDARVRCRRGCAAVSRSLGRQLLRSGQRVWPTSGSTRCARRAARRRASSVGARRRRGSGAASTRSTRRTAALHHLASTSRPSALRLLGLDPFDVTALLRRLDHRRSPR